MVKCKCCKKEKKRLWPLGICKECWKKPATESTLGYPMNKSDKILKELKEWIDEEIKRGKKQNKIFLREGKYGSASACRVGIVILRGVKAEIKELEE